MGGERRARTSARARREVVGGEKGSPVESLNEKEKKKRKNEEERRVNKGKVNKRTQKNRFVIDLIRD